MNVFHSVLSDIFRYFIVFQVKHWVTLHEPNWDCILAYRYGIIAPLLNASDDGAYICTHTKILAHAEAYRRLKMMPSSIQGQ